MTSVFKTCTFIKPTSVPLTLKSKTTHFLFYLNISSLQAHFDELNDLLLQLAYSLSIIILSETRINVAPTINVNIRGYTFEARCGKSC